MELAPKQQIIELLKNAGKILILSAEGSDGDCVGSVLALRRILHKLNKEVTAIVLNPILEEFKFLPEHELLATDSFLTRDFIISLDLKEAIPDSVSYRYLKEANSLSLIVTLKSGRLERDSISVEEAKSKFDLIFILDTPSLRHLGDFYTQNNDFFYQSPIINIDHHPQNDLFGKVNLVDLTATSTSEILVSLLESLGQGNEQLIDPEIATALLLGIIFDTQSFQNQNTTPKALTVAAQLYAAGALKEKIIECLYKTKPLSALKLWGKVLFAIEQDPQSKIIWSKIKKSDFLETSSSEADINALLLELLRKAKNASLCLILFEKDETIEARAISLLPNFDLSSLTLPTAGKITANILSFQAKSPSLSLAEEEILQLLKDSLKTQGIMVE